MPGKAKGGKEPQQTGLKRYRYAIAGVLGLLVVIVIVVIVIVVCNRKGATSSDEGPDELFTMEVLVTTGKDEKKIT